MAVTTSADEPGSARFTRSTFMLGSLGFAASVAGIQRLRFLDTATAATAIDSCGWVPWEMVHGLARDAFNSKDAELRAAGYRLVRISGYGNGSKPLLTGIWESRPSSDHIVELVLTRANFTDRNRAHGRRGYRLLAVDGFNLNGAARYNGIWERSPGSPRVRVQLGMNASTLSDKVDEYLLDGYLMTDVSGFELNGRALFAALWRNDEPDSAFAYGNLTGEDFLSKAASMPDGYSTVDLSAYEVAGATRYAAIWTKYDTGVVAPPNMLQDSLDRESIDWRYRGFRPLVVDAYPSAGQPTYSTLWRRDGITKDDEDALEKGIEKSGDDGAPAFMEENDIPGLSLAFAKDGRLVYARAFGWANPPANTLPLTVHSRFQIGSASKPITATAIMRLRQDGKLKLADTVFGDGALLGETYGTSPYPERLKRITVRHLLEHTAGWPNPTPAAPGPNPMAEDDTLDREGLIDYVIDNSGRGETYELINEPGAVHGYSGFGYLLLTRIIEVRSGMTYENYVKNFVIADADSTIAMASQTESLPNEVCYDGTETPFDPWLVWRRAGGGGWVGSAIDLVRFMTRVDRQNTRTDAISADSIGQMIERSAANEDYGLGWILDPESAIGLSLSVDYWHGGSLPNVRSVIACKEVGDSVYCWAACVNTDVDPEWSMREWFNLVQDGAGWPCLDLF